MRNRKRASGRGDGSRVRAGTTGAFGATRSAGGLIRQALLRLLCDRHALCVWLSCSRRQGSSGEVLASPSCCDRLLEVVDRGIELVAATCVTEIDDVAVGFGQRVRLYRLAGPRAGLVDAIGSVECAHFPASHRSTEHLAQRTGHVLSAEASVRCRTSGHHCGDETADRFRLAPTASSGSAPSVSPSRYLRLRATLSPIEAGEPKASPVRLSSIWVKSLRIGLAAFPLLKAPP